MFVLILYTGWQKNDCLGKLKDFVPGWGDLVLEPIKTMENKSFESL